MSSDNFLTLAELSQFTGSEIWYRHPLATRYVYTEGVRYLADKAAAYWLIDSILLLQSHERALGEEFQVWTLAVRPDQSATLCCSDGTDNEIYSQEIRWTDFPLRAVVLWFSNCTLYLPGAH